MTLDSFCDVHGGSQPRSASPGLELDELLVSGGDERLTLDSDGRNKYHLDPRTSEGTLHRGSCTCSPVNDGGRRAAADTLDRIHSGRVAGNGLLSDQRQRLLDLFVPGPHEGADVIFAPSGSDLCFLPILFSSLLDPGSRIVNVVATSEELGSGSLLAHDGRYFAARTQIEDDLPVGELLSEQLDVETVFLPARDDKGGIVDQGREIERLIATRNADDVLIVNLVIGSKSGIENGVRIVERFATDDIIWTVDLCQMRARPALFEHLLELGCLLLCTGSKFYEAPPFCGAMLMPAVWMERLASVEVAPPDGFDSIFSACDFPPALGKLAVAFPAVENLGLLVRWEAALYEMEAFDAVPEPETAGAIAAWHACVVDRIDRSSVLDLLRDQDQTNDSIVSFRIRDAGDGYLDHMALAEVHRRLAVDGASEIRPYQRATIGQPVSYSSGSFLRVAIGSSEVRHAAISGFDPKFDLALIEALEQTAEDLR